MEVYTATVRLAGDMQNTVPKSGLTAAEVVVLRHLHGQDAVVDLVKTGERRVNERRERARLDAFYPAGRIKEVFGVPGSFPLPQVAPAIMASDEGVDLPDEDDDDTDDAPIINTLSSQGASEPPPEGDDDEPEVRDETPARARA